MSHHYIQFSNVKFTYPNGYKALNGISFRAVHGEKVAIIGSNGAGKSTLLLLTNGLLLPTEGEVNVGDIPVTKKTLKNVRRTVGMVFQNPDDQLFMPTVEEDVAFGPLNMDLPREEVERRIDDALAQVSCIELSKRSPMNLSGGQRRRVAIATVLAMRPDILVMDEPTANLDWHGRRNIVEIVRKFSHTCLIATHDIGLIREVCSRCIVIDAGEIVADGATDVILANREIINLLDLPIDSDSFPG